MHEGTRARLWPVGALALAAWLPTAAAGQGGQAPDGGGTQLCAPARAVLATGLGMAAVVEPDTIDDWRTRRVLPGCRVTAAGLTTRSPSGAARYVFRRLRAADWTRTPEPMDSPGEASLRFRKGAADCLFSYASGGLLDTGAALRVDSLVVPGPGQRRYNVVVRCVRALPAAPRLPASAASGSGGVARVRPAPTGRWRHASPAPGSGGVGRSPAPGPGAVAHGRGVPLHVVPSGRR